MLPDRTPTDWQSPFRLLLLAPFANPPLIAIHFIVNESGDSLGVKNLGHLQILTYIILLLSYKSRYNIIPKLSHCWRTKLLQTNYLVVFVTTPSVDIGQQIADTLVERGIAACVKIISPVNSIYIWQGERQNDEETLLMVKTTQDRFSEKLIPIVQEIHPYDVPEIIALPIVLGLENYLDWISESTKRG
jgi:periplasmic divalent cation tolerance protein